jgi:glycosyltransferase involved in cell wall biosynthesis
MTKELITPSRRSIYQSSSLLKNMNHSKIESAKPQLPEIVFISSYPPRECGIATYTQDLLEALNRKFTNTFELSICALESNFEQYDYDTSPKYILNTEAKESYNEFTKKINENENVKVVVVQHEFGLFASNEELFYQLCENLEKPIAVIFHTVLPQPAQTMLYKVMSVAKQAEAIVVMTNNAAEILMNDYGIRKEKITVIPHGTHLIPNEKKDALKAKYELSHRKVLSTFGLLSANKGIEVTLNALPSIIEKDPTVLFLIIGITHPQVLKKEGGKYRAMLQDKVDDLRLNDHVKFINHYLPLNKLLDYLQLTDIYLFTSTDRNQAVSGTFSYALGCGCPVISTAIPHAKELLEDEGGIVIDFNNSHQLAEAANKLLNNEDLRTSISNKSLEKMASTVWENSALAHANLFKKISQNNINLKYKMPEFKLNHIIKLTTHFGMIQFSHKSTPDIHSGYTLDDNARALILLCSMLDEKPSISQLHLINIYFQFIKFCQQKDGSFLNYVHEDRTFTTQNEEVNLDDSNGRAIWALGYLISKVESLPQKLIIDACNVLELSIPKIVKMHSTRAMAFTIKGLYFYANPSCNEIIKTLANKLVQMYKHEKTATWHWYESYLTYGNSVIPEALLYAFIATNEYVYKDIAIESFNFLLNTTFSENMIKVVSNKKWMQRDAAHSQLNDGGEQAIDVAYTILALKSFYDETLNGAYKQKLFIAYNWFLGNNHLNQIIYNPCTGGCYDGLEEFNINLNQGAESTISYLISHLAVAEVLNSNLQVNLKMKEQDVNAMHEII